MQKAVSFNDVAIVFVNGRNYKTMFLHMRKDEAVNLSDLTGKKWNVIKDKTYYYI